MFKTDLVNKCFQHRPGTFKLPVLGLHLFPESHILPSYLSLLPFTFHSLSFPLFLLSLSFLFLLRMNTHFLQGQKESHSNHLLQKNDSQ